MSADLMRAARALLRACGRDGYRASVGSQVLEAAGLDGLTDEQRDGLVCAFCGIPGDPLIPITHPPGRLVVHPDTCTPVHQPELGEELVDQALEQAGVTEQNVILGEWIVEHADNVQDMGRRVVEVLGRDPRDHHYAGDKLGHALGEAARALTLVGWTRDELNELVRVAHEKAAESKRRLERDLRVERELREESTNVAGGMEAGR